MDFLPQHVSKFSFHKSVIKSCNTTKISHIEQQQMTLLLQQVILQYDVMMIITQFLPSTQLVDLALISKQFLHFCFGHTRVNLWRLDKPLVDSALRDVNIRKRVQEIQFTHLSLKVMYQEDFDNDLGQVIELSKPFVHHLDIRTVQGVNITCGFEKLVSLKLHAVNGHCMIDKNVCERLERLEFSYLDNNAIRSLLETKNLQYLNIVVRELIDGDALTCEELTQVLQNNSNTLKDLTIKVSDAKIQESMFEMISMNCPNLEKLTLSFSRVDLITSFPVIDTLQSACLEMTVQSAKTFVKTRFPNLQHLKLTLIQRDSDVLEERFDDTPSLADTNPFPNLKTLELSSPVDASFVLNQIPTTLHTLDVELPEDCPSLYRFNKLKRLAVDGPNDSVQILKNNEDIEQLKIIVPLDDNTDLFRVLSQRHSLRTLELDGITLEADTLDIIAESCPNLFSIYIHHVANPVKEAVVIGMTKTANWKSFIFEPIHEFVMESSVLLNMPELRFFKCTINHTDTVNNLLKALCQMNNKLEDISLHFYFGFAAIQKRTNTAVTGRLIPNTEKMNIEVKMPCWPVGAVDSLITLCVSLGRYAHVTFDDDYRFSYWALNHRSGVIHEDREYYKKQFSQLCKQFDIMNFGTNPHSALVIALLSSMLKNSVEQHMVGLTVQQKRHLLDLFISDMHTKKCVFHHLVQHYLWRLAQPPAPQIPVSNNSSIPYSPPSPHHMESVPHYNPLRKKSCVIS
jgi:hypothetical protein